MVPEPPAEDTPPPLKSLWHTWEELHRDKQHRSVCEWMHDSEFDLQGMHQGYTAGQFTLEERAWAEQMFLSICHELSRFMDPSNKTHRPIIEELQQRLADKLYVNFSLFQSLPDAWGIDQNFPALPLEYLNRPLTRLAVILDITCDSDGAIKHYVDEDDIENTVPFPGYDAKNPPLLGFFMAGAYQEILGNMHNLFGNI